MKTSKLFAVATICAGSLVGCQALPQAGLIYSSTVTAGLGLKVSASDATAPVDISIGFKTADVAYVPVAVAEEGRDGRQGIEKVWATHSSSNGQLTECLDTKTRLLSGGKKPKDLLPADKAMLESACDYKRDALSVYGQFNGDAQAKAGDKSASLMVGRVFATGVAAQNVSKAAQLTALSTCIVEVTKLFPIDVEARAAALKRLCGTGD
jgi:hypothetical protein